jgi:hypothetical protein
MKNSRSRSTNVNLQSVTCNPSTLNPEPLNLGDFIHPAIAVFRLFTIIPLLDGP